MAPISYVAVFWEKDRQFTVQSVSCVKNKEMLKNPKLVGDVEHVGKEKDKPKEGWKSYPARIIATGAKKLNTQQRGQMKYDEIMEIIQETQGKKKKGKQVKPSVSLSSSESENSANSSASSAKSILSSTKKCAASTPKPLPVTRDIIFGATKGDDLSDEDDEHPTRQQLVAKLEKVIKEKEALEVENEELKRNNIILQKDLPALVSTIQRSQLLSRNNFGKHSDTSGEGSPPPRKVFCSSSSPEFSASPSSYVSQSADREKKEKADSEEAILKFISYEDLEWARFKANRNGTYMVARLMDKLFTDEEMETRSLTGKNTTKPPLPLDKLDALRRFVIANFRPEMDHSKVNVKITNYLRDKAAKKPKSKPDSSSTTVETD